MGIQLDWEVEAERDRVRHTEEDPESVRARRRARRRALLVVLAFLGLSAAALGAAALRLNAVQQAEIEELRATVESEIAALRVGDRQAFLNFQRSASEDWIERQRAAFDQTQRAFLTSDLQLTGTIRAVAIQDRTARVIVEEISGGVVRQRAWFYWRYEDGWFHVLPDYTFWGDPAVLSGERVTVNYRTLDSAFASALHDAAERWMAVGCEAVGCELLPTLTIDITPDAIDDMNWQPPATLIVRSPYADVYEPDAPLNAPSVVGIPGLIAERLVDDALAAAPQYPADAFFLRRAAITWLYDTMTGAPTTSYLLNDLAARFGPGVIGTIIRGIGPMADADAIPALIGLDDLAALAADWRDYLTWRLSLERDFIAAGDMTGLLALYDPANPALTVVAQARLQAGIPEERTVVSARQSTADDGVPQVRTLVRIGDDPARQEEITFRFVNGLWLRAS